MSNPLMNLTRISELARDTLRRFGFDLIRFRSLNSIFSQHGIDVVFDVGANVGQYATQLRRLGYRGRIVSFEPQATAFATLSALAAKDPGWTAVHAGLGSADGQLTMNIYNNTALSSMFTLDESVFEHQARKVGTETIEIRTVDGVLDRHVRPEDRVFLKIDTQGYEQEVLRGAEASFSRLVGIQIEMSLTPIYPGRPTLDEMIALLKTKGFVLWQIQRGICRMGSSQEMEADGIFIHQSHVK